MQILIALGALAFLLFSCALTIEPADSDKLSQPSQTGTD